MSSQTFTVAAAAEACQVSHRTVRRKLDAGSFPEASRDQAGRWLIPLADLLAAGLKPYAPSPPDAIADPEAIDKLAALETEVTRLTAALSEERRARDVAQTEARLQAEMIDLLKTNVLPQLQAGMEQVQKRAMAAEERATAAEARRWWKRRS
jgi:hypothetical protein